MTSMGNQSNGNNTWDTLQEEINIELNRIEGVLRDGGIKLEQSRAEVTKLAQRNSTATERLHQVRNKVDNISRNDMLKVFDAALNAQQRLFVIRGQVEKLQNEKEHLGSYKKTLLRVRQGLEDIVKKSSDIADTGTAYSNIEATIQAQEAERQRLSKQMHDGPAQALSNFILQTEIAMRLFDVNKDQAREELLDLKESATSTFKQVRQFIFELRPMMLDDLGLVPTLKRYIKEFEEQTDVHLELSVSGIERRLESYVDVVVFRAIQELLGFAQRQGHADQVKVDLDISNANVKVTIEDNGKGYDGGAIFEIGGLAVKAIKDRVEMLGGFMEVDSEIGRGALITLQVPVDASEHAIFAEM
ncbi:MAG: sensor histidine kinase [Chloroflexi bacterium]|nr:sensor histidine kinase [Chloroflexota bacterium]